MNFTYAEGDINKPKGKQGGRQSPNKEKGLQIGEKMDGEFLYRREPPKKISDKKIHAIFKEQQVHIQRWLVKPVWIEVSTAKGNGSINKVLFISKIGKGEVMDNPEYPHEKSNKN